MFEIIDFEWEVDDAGYEIVEVTEPPANPLLPDMDTSSGLYLRARGGTRHIRRPLDEEPGLFKTFADTPTTPEGVLKLASNYGFLIWPLSLFSSVARLRSKIKAIAPEDEQIRRMLALPSSMPNLHPQEPLSLWYETMALMRALLHHEKAGSLGSFVGTEKLYTLEASLNVPVEPEPGTQDMVSLARPHLRLRPPDLRSAIVLQYSMHASNPVGKLLQCEQCGKWFPAGPGTKKRTSAKFCSRPCVERAKYERRKLQKA